nr:phosphatidylserine decarboxylase proenzyme 2-like [Ipomoea batatas]
MGHAASKSDTSSSDSDSGDSQRPSRIRRFGQRLRLRPSLRRHCRHARRKKTTSGSHSAKLLSEEDFAGIARLRLVNATMKFKDKWLACVTLGFQTFRTHTSDQLGEEAPFRKPWGTYCKNLSLRNNLIGYCEIDLLDYLSWGKCVMSELDFAAQALPTCTEIIAVTGYSRLLGRLFSFNCYIYRDFISYLGVLYLNLLVQMSIPESCSYNTHFHVFRLVESV